MKKGTHHSGKYTFDGLLGAEGLMTFEFFSKSLADTLSDFMDVMAENHIDVPQGTEDLFDMLEDISIDLWDDYHADCLRLGVFKEKILDFYSLAFALCNDLEKSLSDGPDEAVYYGQIFFQGLKHFLPAMLQSILMDLPESQNLYQFIEQTEQDFIGLTPSGICERSHLN